ncbi:MULTISPECIES: hypothetical protein [Aeromonas]|uniref:hypothetical protein n=1 Tax=Aeromonas TaxID=642 RepID=UPI001C22C81F|nr:hypothetical protein [Aeromonas sp. FDAARGOS 1407]QXC35299.1 hypothetical protein I6L37_06490 [Aeromonas sp. FDAARGOS 1407]
MGQGEHIGAAFPQCRLNELIFHKLFIWKPVKINFCQGSRDHSWRNNEAEQYDCTQNNAYAYDRINDVTITETAGSQAHQLAEQQVVHNQQQGEQDIHTQSQFTGMPDVQPHQYKIGEDQVEQELLDYFPRFG